MSSIVMKKRKFSCVMICEMSHHYHCRHHYRDDVVIVVGSLFVCWFVVCLFACL